MDVELNRTGRRAHYKPSAPSVTELLSWAGYYDQYPPDSDGFYRRRGNFIEQYATILLQGLEVDDRTLRMAHAHQPGHDEHWIDYINGLNKWRSQHQIKFIGAQIYVYNPWETYQGTMDWLLEIDGALTVVDCKTGTCPKATALQTAGYAMAYKAWIGDVTTTIARLGLQLEPGKCTEHWYKDHKDFDAFRILARCYHMHGPQSRKYR